jgi:hypothetical protein
MKRFRIIAVVLCLLIALPLVVNLFGWNLFIYLQSGDRDLIAAASLGVAHFALSEHYEEDLSAETEEQFEWHRGLFHLGPLDIFAEKSGEPLQPFTFRLIKPSAFSDYRGVEFPWLLWVIFPAMGWLGIRWKKTEKDNGTNCAPPSKQHDPSGQK